MRYQSLRAFCYNLLNHQPEIFVDDKEVCSIAHSYIENVKFLTEYHMKIMNRIEKITDNTPNIEKNWAKAPKIENIFRNLN